MVHGTTTADNTMIEQDGAAVGLLVTEGHRDEIEMRRVHKEQIWDPSYPAPFPIARRRSRIPIPERVDFEGQVLLPLDEDAVRAGIRRLRQLGAESFAVMFLFSFVNPAHERRARELILEEYPEVGHISLSHEVMPRGPEFERTSTTLVNAYVAPRVSSYVHGLGRRLRDAGYQGELLIMAATGGVMPPATVSRRAVALLGSGPTGGVIGAAAAAARAGTPDFVAVDMGGTSFDICLVRGGEPEISTDWNWRYRYYIGMPMVDVQCVGAGGGSIARVRQGSLLVGPDSAGSSPGPACYGRGGTAATVTDADAVLGFLPLHGFAGGRMALDLAAAKAAVTAEVAEPLGIDVVDAAWGIERIVNANMANATRRVLAGSGVDPRQLDLIAYGGNGPVHAWAIAAELGLDRVLVPKAAPAFSALGLLVSDFRVDLTRSYVTPLSRLDLDHLHGLADELDAEVSDELAPTDLAPEAVVRTRFVQMAYAGQNFDMSVPAPDPGEPAEVAARRAGRAVPRPPRGRPRLLVPHPGPDRAGRAHHRPRAGARTPDAGRGGRRHRRGPGPDRRPPGALRRRLRRHPGVRRGPPGARCARARAGAGGGALHRGGGPTRCVAAPGRPHQLRAGARWVTRRCRAG